MRKDYDDLKDEHVGHTEENPDPTCYLCREYGYIDEEKQRQKKQQRREERKKQRKEEKIERLQKEIEEHQEVIDEADHFGEILDESRDYNQKYKKLKRLAPEKAEQYTPYDWR